MNHINNTFGAGLYDVKFFSYRSATVQDRFLALPREIVADLERALADAAGVRMDNHSCYSFFQDEYRCPVGRRQVYVLFTDATAVFGWSLKEERW